MITQYRISCVLFAENVSSIQPEIPVRILPDDSFLHILTFLVCNPEPNSQLTRVDYVSRWTIPSGETFTFNVSNPPAFEQYAIYQGQYNVGQVRRESTVLLVLNLSYQDAGNYTCEVRSSASTQSPWFSASFELQLEGRDTPGPAQ